MNPDSCALAQLVRACGYKLPCRSQQLPMHGYPLVTGAGSVRGAADTVAPATLLRQVTVV